MTETNDPVAVAEIVYLNETYKVASVDVTDHGALIVTLEGRVQLLPWHTLHGIEFYDTPDAVDLPAGHEGSE